MSALLAVRDLAVHYSLTGGWPFRRPAQLRALDGVSFDLGNGETLGVVGESGCGKSTLARALLGLVEPSAGQVLWRGANLLPLDDRGNRGKRRALQMVFQDPLGSLDPRMTAGEVVAEPLRSFEPWLKRDMREVRVAKMLELVSLTRSMINRYPHEFSGGQCQRLGIARAMISEPEVLIADEAVSALDVSVQAQIINLLVRLQREMGLAMLFISHNVAVVRHVSHRILVMYLGRIVEAGPAEALCSSPLHPYSQALIAAVPVPHWQHRSRRRPLPLQGDPPSQLQPPSGCAFRDRCPIAVPRCAVEPPALRAAPGDRVVACHLAC